MRVPAPLEPRRTQIQRRETGTQLAFRFVETTCVWVAAGGCPPAAPAVPYVRPLTHTVPHLLSCSTGPMRIRLEALTDFRLALPENEAFLKANLSKNNAGELDYAEQAH